MKYIEQILQNKYATAIVFIIIFLLVIYFMFIRPKRKGTSTRAFTVADIPNGAKEGTPQQIFDDSKQLAESLYADWKGFNVTGHNSTLLQKLAYSSDTYFIAVWNHFGLREGENLSEWLTNERTLNPWSDLLKYGEIIQNRVKALNLI